MSELNIDDEFKKVNVHKVMTKDIIAASPNNKFSQVFQFFSERNINHIPVCEDGVIKGIISNKDMMRILYKYIVYGKNSDIAALDEQIKITDIMSKNPMTIDANTNLAEVRELFYKLPFSCLPITYEGKLVGVMTPKDFVKLKIIQIDGSEYGGY
ncbi:MAG: CBS domain-containing protein [Chitinophagales bacterium]|nr:CBS domain-containing protein [Chitinophagales bacterium]